MAHTSALVAAVEPKDAPPEQVSVDVQELAAAVGDSAALWLKQEAASARDTAERIDYDLRICSFLRRDASGGYSFSHRSFLEHFAALHPPNRSPIPMRHFGSRLGTYGNAVALRWPSAEVIAFLIAMARSSAKRRDGFLAVAYALDVSHRNLHGAQLSGAALASPNLEGTDLTDSVWTNAAIRINHVYDVGVTVLVSR